MKQTTLIGKNVKKNNKIKYRKSLLCRWLSVCFGISAPWPRWIRIGWNNSHPKWYTKLAIKSAKNPFCVCECVLVWFRYISLDSADEFLKYKKITACKTRWIEIIYRFVSMILLFVFFLFLTPNYQTIPKTRKKYIQTCIHRYAHAQQLITGNGQRAIECSLQSSTKQNQICVT